MATEPTWGENRWNGSRTLDTNKALRGALAIIVGPRLLTRIRFGASVDESRRSKSIRE